MKYNFLPTIFRRVFVPLVMTNLFFCSCMEKFLDERYNYSQAIPETLDDYLAIMDNSVVFSYISPLDFGVMSADEYFVEDERYNALSSELDKNIYIWAKDVIGMEDIREWDAPYKRILHSNIVIDGLESKVFDANDQEKKESILGTAYFMRAFSHYELSQVFCKQYDVSTAKTDLGIPLRLEYDVNVIAKRSTVEQVYNQVIKDLEYSIELLPQSTLVRERPNKGAALTLLARVYLQQENYEQAYHYATLALKVSSALLDFKTIPNPGELRPDGTYFTFDQMKQTNPEVLFMFYGTGRTLLPNWIAGGLYLDPLLLASYSASDLRKKVYFYKDGDYDVFVGTYTGTEGHFVGVATDELYLIFAEAACRLEKVKEALEHLNILLEHRFDDTFVPLVIRDKQLLLERILEERRKELFLRGMRWSDLRRLNKDPAFATTLYRKVNGEIIELKPNSDRYVFPIPNSSILQSGLENNYRD